MKVIVSALKFFTFEINPTFFVKIFILAVISFSIITIKVSCIKIGYEISRLNKRAELLQIDLESAKLTYYELTKTEKLIKEAENLGMILPSPGNVYYVE